MPVDISTYQSNIYSVPIGSVALAALLNNVAVTDLTISSPITVSDSVQLVIDNPNLAVVATAPIVLGLTSANWRTFQLMLDQGQGTMLAVHGSDVQIKNLKSWDGGGFASSSGGDWAFCSLLASNVAIKNCAVPFQVQMNASPFSYAHNTNVIITNVTGVKKINGAVDGAHIHNISVPTLYIELYGSDNIVEYINTTGGYSTITFISASPYIYIPMVNNIIRYNTLLNCDTTEVICYDCGRSDAAMDNPRVDSVDTALRRIYCPTSATTATFTGNKRPLVLLPSGSYFFITAISQGSYIEVDITGKYGTTDLAAIAVGDLLIIQAAFANNKIYGNRWTLDPNAHRGAGVSLWGACVDNEIYDNIGPNSYDVTVICDFPNSLRGQGNNEVAAWELPQNCVNSGNYWHDNDFENSRFWVASQYFDSTDFPKTYNDVSNVGINTNIRTENNSNIAYGLVYDALNTTWKNDGPVITDYPEPENAGKPKHVTFAAGSTVTYYVPPPPSPPPPLLFASQPVIQSNTSDGAVVAYATVDPGADDVASTGTIYASVADKVTLRDAASAIISAGVSTVATQAMLESVFCAAQTTASVIDTVKTAEALLAQIQAFPSVQDIMTLAIQVVQPFIFVAQPTVSMSTGDGGIIAYGTVDTQADDVATSASATTQVTDLLTRLEAVLTTVQAIPTVSDLFAQVETIASTAEAQASVVDVKLTGVAESLQSAAQGLASASDVQLMVDNVTIMSRSSATLTEITAYLETLSSAVTAQISVSDTLRGSFVGRYLFANQCQPRQFTNTAAIRSFTDQYSLVSYN